MSAIAECGQDPTTAPRVSLSQDKRRCKKRSNSYVQQPVNKSKPASWRINVGPISDSGKGCAGCTQESYCKRRVGGHRKLAPLANQIQCIKYDCNCPRPYRHIREN